MEKREPIFKNQAGKVQKPTKQTSMSSRNKSMNLNATLTLNYLPSFSSDHSKVLITLSDYCQRRLAWGVDHAEETNYDTSESKLRREFEIYGPIRKSDKEFV
ncbi:hypothetical protein LOTGIDRAFT_169477 [Lottia gigantea]|uniref:Uncharacterized protein n=1 Tax=Lottia gigantea TaxID=225164 RepID=V4B499_LOTGI|nr:hypothetical protein LOTGIDRAFT_169477 [Lottia gigantea]ESO83259.1 hypothetical protein LOTGIDRAFT_169477 [Lottia gigantea]